MSIGMRPRIVLPGYQKKFLSQKEKAQAEQIGPSKHADTLTIYTRQNCGSARERTVRHCLYGEQKKPQNRIINTTIIARR